MWIKREILDFLTRVSKKRPAIVLTGCRQTGKTSLLREAFPQARYVSLDLPLDAAEAEEAGDRFLSKHPSPIIIDEIQYAPAFLRYLKKEIDRSRQSFGRFFLTGSQKLEMMEGVSESLAGRAAILELHSLSALEWESHSTVKMEEDQLWEWIWKGGYPEIHAQEINPSEFFSDYLATYLERDVRRMINIKDMRDFERFLRLLSLRNGQLVSYSAIASDLGVSSPTIKSWMSVLEASNIIAFISPYFNNLGKSVVKTPKMYFLDTGLSSFLAGLRDPESLRCSPLKGAFFEAHVFGQIVRYFSNKGERPNLYFYRDQYGHESDFILAEGPRFHVMECKLTAQHPKDISGMIDFKKQVGEKNILSESVICVGRGTTYLSPSQKVTNSVDLDPIFKSNESF